MKTRVCVLVAAIAVLALSIGLTQKWSVKSAEIINLQSKMKSQAETNAMEYQAVYKSIDWDAPVLGTEAKCPVYFDYARENYIYILTEETEPELLRINTENTIAKIYKPIDELPDDHGRYLGDIRQLLGN